jgi:hypothetical protein
VSGGGGVGSSGGGRSVDGTGSSGGSTPTLLVGPLRTGGRLGIVAAVVGAGRPLPGVGTLRVVGDGPVLGVVVSVGNVGAMESVGGAWFVSAGSVADGFGTTVSSLVVLGGV